MANRGPAGTERATRTKALLAEARVRRDGPAGWQIATDGPLTLVGDLRLWNTNRLTDLAGTDADDHRQLLLAAYRHHGADMMDAVDGDFAFVIWDDDTGTLFAARDRFGVKPLFLRHTDTGILAASSVAQLIAADPDAAQPDAYAIQEYLSGRQRFATRTFIEGVHRLLPAHTATVSADPSTECTATGPCRPTPTSTANRTPSPTSSSTT